MSRLRCGAVRATLARNGGDMEDNKEPIAPVESAAVQAARGIEANLPTMAEDIRSVLGTVRFIRTVMVLAIIGSLGVYVWNYIAAERAAESWRVAHPDYIPSYHP